MRRINLFTIPAGVSFADELARGIVSRYGDAADPFALSRLLILLPTRRALRTMSEAFARVSAGGVAVLPRMRALGDFDEAPTLIDDNAALDATRELAPDLPAPMSTLRRELLFTRMIQQWAASAKASGQALGASAPSLALKLARDLAALLDQATAEGLEWERLKTIVPDELSEHWEKTLQFLEILTATWPVVLRAENASDPAAHRDAALREAARRWREKPPEFQVVAAGSTGSVPATAELLRTIAHMPNGAVVLPGIDLTLDPASWQAMESGHPQHAMKQLLVKFDATRGDVEQWVDFGGKPQPGAARDRLIAEALRPAETTPAWRTFITEERGIVEEGLRGLSALVARTPAVEALTIACALRQTIETPGKTAALVTPDRILARRVASELKRWGIEIDDSGGTPLSHTIPGRFLCLLADAAAEQFAPVPLLALLKHPLTTAGFPRAEMRALAVDLERTALRGPRPAPGFAGLKTVVGSRSHLVPMIEKLDLACGAFATVMTGTHDVTTFVRSHREAAELLSAVGTDMPLWAQDAGEAAELLFETFAEEADGIDLPMTGGDYAAFIRTVMEAISVRPLRGRHPRLAILGPLEVRLQRADLMILGGLNEGVWPPATDPGPWLNRPMRRDLDVSQPERRVGLSAHDFAQAAASAEVLLTRSEKDGGAPTTPSRWLTRLNMLVEGAGLADRLHNVEPLLVAQRLDVPREPAKPITAPEPKPPVAVRPRKLPVTQVELWVRDPYALYARQVLGLKKLDAIDETPAAAERGTMIHNALERFVQQFPDELPDDATARDILLKCGRQAFGEMLERPGVRSFWWPRFERIAEWFLGFERRRRALGAKVLSEQKGTLTIDAPAGPFVLTAKADRLEVMPGGAIVVGDYKTGRVPTSKQVTAGLSPQLTLEAAIALAGGFPGVTVHTVDDLLYIALKGGVIAGEEKSVDPGNDKTAAQLVATARAGFEKFVAQYDAQDMPYLSRPHVLFERMANDYDHLARVKEWSQGDDDDIFPS